MSGKAIGMILTTAGVFMIAASATGLLGESDGFFGSNPLPGTAFLLGACLVVGGAAALFPKRK